MLELRFATETFPLQWSELTQPEVLVLYSTTLTSLPQYSQSLTILVIDSVAVGGTTSNPMAFLPHLPFSVWSNGLKPYINIPCLVTFHGGWGKISESFSSPVPSIVEHGVFRLSFDAENPAK